MERRQLAWVSWIGCGMMTLAGCNRPADSGGPKASSGEQATPRTIATSSTTAAARPADGPADVVRQFLKAVQQGDDAAALQWLTPVARQKTQEMQMSVVPEGTETAQFDVGEVEMVEGGAHVASTWSDLDPEGNRRADPIVWVLAQEAEGWRIAGMATTLFEEKLPIVFNFEDPEEMLRKQQLVEAEVQRRAAQASKAQPVETTPPATTAPGPGPTDRMTEQRPAEEAESATASRNGPRRNKLR